MPDLKPNRSLVDEPVTGRSPFDATLSDADRAEQQRNLLSAQRFLDLLQAEDIEAFLELWGSEARQDMPYPPPGFPESLADRQRIAEQYRALPGTYDYMRYTSREYFTTHDPRVIIVRFLGDIKLKAKDKKYDNRYFNIFVFDEHGKITRDIEHFNPLVLMEGGAFGEGGRPTGRQDDDAASISDPAQWARDFFALVDGRDADAVAARLTENAQLSVANRSPVRGRNAICQAFRETYEAVERTHHKLTGIWTGKDGVHQVLSCEAQVTYMLPDATEVTVPCTSTLRLEGDLVADYRIFADLTPVFGSTASSAG